MVVAGEETLTASVELVSFPEVDDYMEKRYLKNFITLLIIYMNCICHYSEWFIYNNIINYIFYINYIIFTRIQGDVEKIMGVSPELQGLNGEMLLFTPDSDQLMRCWF